MESEGEPEMARLTEERAPEARIGWPAIVGAAVALALALAFGYFALQPVQLFSWHPILMGLAWLIFMTSGVNAFSPAEIALQWMPIQNRNTRHWVLQVCAIICLTAGAVIMFIVKEQNGKPHYATLHGIFGLISCILVYLTASGGLITLYGMKFKRILAPVYIKLIHSGVGLITYLSGITTITIILFSHWWRWGEIARIFMLTLVIVHLIWTTLRPGVKLYNRVRERLDYIRASN